MSPEALFSSILVDAMRLPGVAGVMESLDGWDVTLEPPSVVMTGPTLRAHRDDADVYVLISGPNDEMPTVEDYRLDIMSNEWGTEVLIAVRDEQGLRITYADPG